MLDHLDGRSESRSFVSVARTAALFLLLVGSGYAISTQVGAVDSSKCGNPAVVQPGPESLAPTDYFPAQYVNQARHAEEHIQAF